MNRTSEVDFEPYERAGNNYNEISLLKKRIDLLEGLVERMGRRLCNHIADEFAHMGEEDAMEYPLTIEGEMAYRIASDAHNLPEDAPPGKDVL